MRERRVPGLTLASRSAGAELAAAGFVPDEEADSVVALEVRRAGLFRRRLRGYACTGEALCSSYLDAPIRYGEIGGVAMSAHGVEFRMKDGTVTSCDFEEFNEHVHLVISSIIRAIG